MPTRFKGIIPPLVTPLRDRDTLDVLGLECLIEHVIAGGVSGLFLLGTTGEAPSLSYRLRRELIERACLAARGRVPVLVGITDTAFVESVTLARVAADNGASALVLTTPYYFPAGQTELTGYIRNIVAELPLPLVLYNMPGMTKVWFEAQTLRSLASLPSIVGVKDSSGDLAYYEAILTLRAERPDWSFFMGPEHLLLESLRLGGDGGVAGGANILPHLFVACVAAFRAGDSTRQQQVQARIEALQRIYTIGKYASRHIKATKCALSLMGICGDCMAEPFHRFHDPERMRVRAILEDAFPELIQGR